MSRVIKFRAWNDIDNTMCDNGVTLHRLSALMSIKNYHVMQFSGLTDKNGVEIYEGDILQDSSLTDNAYKSGAYSRGEVVFYDSAFMQCYTHDDGKKHYERINNRDVVVGNIYKNPELLK